MKNILKIISVASISIAALVSCDQENIKATYTPEQENEVSFAAEVYTNTEIPATADTINVVITRNSADNAVTVPLTTTLPSEITVPSSVSFEAGEYQTNVVLQLAILGGVRYTGTISISDSTMFNSNTSLYPTVSLTLQQAYNWQSLGNGEFYDNICGMLLTPEIMQATNALQPLYRIMNPYTAEASEAIATAIGGATGGPKSEYIEFTVDESCGKCTPCRIGTRRMLEILEKITKGQATMEDLDKLEELCYHLQSSSLCALGQTAPNPVLSTLRYFRDEYIAHIVDKKCPAGVCKALLQYKIDPDKCKGCTLCARTCPADAITGSVREVHMIDPEKCLKCGACMEKCRFGAIYKE